MVETDIAVVIQGDEVGELPERLLCCLKLRCIDVELRFNIDDEKSLDAPGVQIHE